MTLTIYRGNDDTYVMVGCNDKRLRDYDFSNYDGYKLYWVNIDANEAYFQLSHLASWVNNELGEECLFEMD